MLGGLHARLCHTFLVIGLVFSPGLNFDFLIRSYIVFKKRKFRGKRR